MKNKNVVLPFEVAEELDTLLEKGMPKHDILTMESDILQSVDFGDLAKAVYWGYDTGDTNEKSLLRYYQYLDETIAEKNIANTYRDACFYMQLGFIKALSLLEKEVSGIPKSLTFNNIK